jgi:putative hydrolase of the HAD superfamily
LNSLNVVFDFGAVVFNWQPEQLVASHFPAQAATPLAAQQLARAIFSHNDWHGFDQGAVAMDEVIHLSARRLDLPLAQMRELVLAVPDHLTPKDDTVAILQALVQRRLHAEIRLFYLSNMPSPFARVLEQRHEFMQWFDGGIFSGDVKLIKPDPAIYGLLETRFALEPGHTVFIDDLKTNVIAAQARGWRAIHFESAKQLENSLNSVFSGI